MVSDAPLLALPSGSILQFLLMTFPLLCVYLFFLFLAFDRPNIADPDNPRYSNDRIRLTDVLYTYLATFVLFACLAVYLAWFVNKRRKLSRRYEQEAIVILGNVEYDETYNSGSGCCANLRGWVANGFALRNNYGTVVYDLARVANHPACDHESPPSGTIAKRVRVYYRYPREQVSILVLPDHPFSGQPKIDMEADWTSFAEETGLPPPSGRDGPGDPPRARPRDGSRGVLLVAASWMAFLLLASLYVVKQIIAVEGYYDDENGTIAWIIFGSFVGGGVLIVAFGGNWIRWKVYENWILSSGKRRGVPSTSSSRSSRKKRRSRRGPRGDDGEEGSYVQMT